MYDMNEFTYGTTCQELALYIMMETKNIVHYEISTTRSRVDTESAIEADYIRSFLHILVRVQ